LGVNEIAESLLAKFGKRLLAPAIKAALALSPPGMLAFGATRFETTGLCYGWRVTRRKTIAKLAIELAIELLLPIPARVFSFLIFVRLGHCFRGHDFAPSRR
jgi:hypothetical protein